MKPTIRNVFCLFYYLPCKRYSCYLNLWKLGRFLKSASRLVEEIKIRNSSEKVVIVHGCAPGLCQVFDKLFCNVSLKLKYYTQTLHILYIDPSINSWLYFACRFHLLIFIFFFLEPFQSMLKTSLNVEQFPSLTFHNLQE